MALQSSDSRKGARHLLPVVFAALALASCTSAETVDALPDDASPVGVEALVTGELVAAADLEPGDQLFRMPATGDRSVLVRIRDGAPPLLFGTSCDVVSAVSLPDGWQGMCLEYTADGQRILGEFPWGTVSTGTDIPAYDTP